MEARLYVLPAKQAAFAASVHKTPATALLKDMAAGLLLKASVHMQASVSGGTCSLLQLLRKAEREIISTFQIAPGWACWFSWIEIHAQLWQCPQQCDLSDVPALIRVNMQLTAVRHA